MYTAREKEKGEEREREIQDVHALQWRSFAAGRRSGFMPVLDSARRNAKVRKPRLAFTAKTRPDPGAALLTISLPCGWMRVASKHCVYVRATQKVRPE